MLLKIKKIKRAFIIYWILLAYIIAALVWWFIALSRQNEAMSQYKIMDIRKDDFRYEEKYQQVVQEKKIKAAQYVGEGTTFFFAHTCRRHLCLSSSKKRAEAKRRAAEFYDGDNP